MKTYKFKLYRSKRNKYLDKLLSTACDIYNFSLSYKKNLYTNDKININKNDIIFLFILQFYIFLVLNLRPHIRLVILFYNR